MRSTPCATRRRPCDPHPDRRQRDGQEAGDRVRSHRARRQGGLGCVHGRPAGGGAAGRCVPGDRAPGGTRRRRGDHRHVPAARHHDRQRPGGRRGDRGAAWPAGGTPARSVGLAGGARLARLARVDVDTATERAAATLSDGSALEALRALVAAQHGDPAVIDDPGAVLPAAPVRVSIERDRAGFLDRVDAAAVGEAAARLGAGLRRTSTSRSTPRSVSSSHRRSGIASSSARRSAPCTPAMRGSATRRPPPCWRRSGSPTSPWRSHRWCTRGARRCAERGGRRYATPPTSASRC